MLVMRSMHKSRRVGKVLEFRILGYPRPTATCIVSKTRESVSNSFRQFPFQSERLGILEWVPRPRCPGCWSRSALLGHDSTTSTTQAEKSSRCRRKSEDGLWTCSEQVAHGSSAAATDIALCKFPFAGRSWQELLAPSVDLLQQAAL